MTLDAKKETWNPLKSIKEIINGCLQVQAAECAGHLSEVPSSYPYHAHTTNKKKA